MGTNEQAQTVLRVLDAVSHHHDREQLFVAIANVLRPVFAFDALIVNLDGPGPDQMTPYFIIPRVAIASLKRSRSALERVFLTGQPIYIRSRADVADRPGSLEAMERFGAHSYIALPLAVRGKVIAALLLQANRPNAYDDIDLPFATEVASAIAVALDNCLAYERIAQSRASLEVENQLMRAELVSHRMDGMIVAESPAMREVMRLVDLVAPTDAAVLVQGQTGAGKERLSRLIHERSPRADKPLHAVNCAAIPSSLIESELFGHEPGAFTGAVRRRRGRFELADKGTLLLDEIGELALDAQAKLLRVLQTRELERLGSATTLRVDVRVIAATNRPLLDMVNAKRFRADLYYRLAVFPIELPPLSERREDMPVLARQLIAESSRKLGFPPPHLDEQTLRALQGYAWPGNVRELQNVLERAVILSHGGLLDVAPLLEVPHEEPVPPLRDDTDGNESSEVRTALESSRWVIEGESGAAAKLGLRPSTLRSRMRRLGIERPR